LLVPAKNLLTDGNEAVGPRNKWKQQLTKLKKQKVDMKLNLGVKDKYPFVQQHLLLSS